MFFNFVDFCLNFNDWCFLLCVCKMRFLVYRELSLRSEEDRCSKMREELLTLREDLNKAYLAKDMLEQQKLETDRLISQIEKNKGNKHYCGYNNVKKVVVCVTREYFRWSGIGAGTNTVRKVGCAGCVDKNRSDMRQPRAGQTETARRIEESNVYHYTDVQQSA